MTIESVTMCDACGTKETGLYLTVAVYGALPSMEQRHACSLKCLPEVLRKVAVEAETRAAEARKAEQKQKDEREAWERAQKERAAERVDPSRIAPYKLPE
jgi:hypothetical protein